MADIDYGMFHICHTTHKTGGQPIENDLCSSFNQQQDGVDQEEKYVILSCGSHDDFLTAHPDMIGYVVTDVPLMISRHVADPSNATYEEVYALVTDEGAAGDKWSAVGSRSL
jgi:hypothetical protein